MPEVQPERNGSWHSPGGHGWFAAFALGALLAALGAVLIPSHWTSIWMDREFTGTVAALANHLEGGVRLYADGGHIPMPPLPFVLVRLLTGGEATWLWESALNFAFQVLAIVLCYLTLARLFRTPVPLLAALVTVPTFLAIEKTVLYDSMAQAAVATLVLQAVAYLGRRTGSDGVRAWLPGIGGLATTSALLLLVKQSTAAGAFIGVAASLLLYDRGRPLERTRRLVAYGASTALAVALIALLLTPWIDPVGLVRDVFIAGAEPKGGPATLLWNLKTFLVDIARHGLVLLPVLAVVVAIASRALSRRARAGGVAAPGAGSPMAIAAGALAAGVALCTARLAGVWPAGAAAPLYVAGAMLLWLGLFLAALLAVRRWVPRFLQPLAGPGRPRAIAGAVTIALAAALSHSLSTLVFRWSYDNNPLVAVAYGALFQVTLALIGRVPRRAARLALVAASCFVAVPFLPWARLAGQLAVCHRCSVRWDEVAHLAGARLQPSAAGMRALVALVRRETAPGDSVLLLPNDPNVEAWFERERPRLSSLFVFADQYRDRRVDADMAALAARPPRLVVLGPVGYWRGFHHLFKWSRGAERLIDRVMAELLPARYSLIATVMIGYQGGQDAMEVYALVR